MIAWLSPLLLVSTALAQDEVHVADEPPPPAVHHRSADGTPMIGDPRCKTRPNQLVQAISLGETEVRGWGDACLAVRVDLAGRGSLTLPEAGISRRLELARGRAEVALEGPGPVTARVAFLATRSAGPAGYLGIDGEAIVPKLQIAEARVDWALTGLSAAAGLIDDTWLMSVQPRWGLRFVAPMIDEFTELSYRADLGAWVGWTAPRNVASLTVSLTAGEGLDFRQRNNGWNTSGTLLVRPLAFVDESRTGILELGLYGRDGSRGVDQARDHRVGAFVNWRHSWLAVGVTTLHGWGFDVDPLRLPSTVSAWVRTGDDVPALGWIRLDQVIAQRGSTEADTLTWRVGGGPVLPFRKGAFRPVPLHLTVGYDGARLGPDARPVAGGETSGLIHEVWIQLGARFGVTTPVTAEGADAVF